MTTTIRSTEKYKFFKANTGMGYSFIENKGNNQSLFDTEVYEDRLMYLIGCSDEEFNEVAKETINEYKIEG